MHEMQALVAKGNGVTTLSSPAFENVAPRTKMAYFPDVWLLNPAPDDADPISWIFMWKPLP
eukprot:1157538-Pelagomonas_calceolata.AAC.3